MQHMSKAAMGPRQGHREEVRRRGVLHNSSTGAVHSGYFARMNATTIEATPATAAMTATQNVGVIVQ
jgi:hypothetical protein